MKISLLLAKLSQSIQEDGFGPTLNRVFRHIRPQWPADEFDLIHGTDTAGDVPLWRLSIRSAYARCGIRYQATHANDLKEAIAFLEEDPSTFTFIDLGCGKGRMLLVAQQLGFKRVIGVEFADELVAIAKNNLSIVMADKSAVIGGDAVEFQFPVGDLVVFLFNPFGEEVMVHVIENLRKHVGKLYVIYRHAKCAHLFDATDFLTRMGSPLSGIVIWHSGAHPDPKTPS
jgi:predicted RNA methylase